MTGWIVLGVALLLLAPAVYDGLVHGNLRRLAWRNLWRRKSEAFLVTIGTMLGTAIIVASFVVGDTIEAGVLSLVYTTHGPMDETVVIDDATQLDELTAAIEGGTQENIDGILPILSMPTVMTTTGDDPLGEPSVWVAEVDFDEARQFGGEPDDTGFAGAGSTPETGEVVLTSQAASPLGAEAGDVVTMHAYGESVDLLVIEVIERAGIAGWNSAYVAPGTIYSVYDPDADIAARPPRGAVAVSNVGDILGGAALTDLAVADLEAATASLPDVRIDIIKQDVLDDAASEGTEFTTLFSGIGSFAVIAGVLLIVNLFVMLAEERKTQLGILRAIGFRRNEVTRAFALEGSIYATTAAVAGTGVGLGIGWILVRVIRDLFFGDGGSFTVDYAIEPGSLLAAAGIGLGLSMLTIWATSLRISRFNVIAAIRDQPNPPARSHRLRSALLGLLGTVAGIAAFIIGLDQGVQVAILAGPAIAAFSAIGYLRLVIPGPLATTALGLAAIAWGALAFTLFEDQMRSSTIAVFVVQGVILVAGSVLVSSSAQRLWQWSSRVLGGTTIGLSARLGLAYPMARKVRTGLLLSMFALVIFTVTFLSVFSRILNEETRSFATESRAGYDLIVRSSSVNPVAAADIADIDGVAGVSPFIRSFAEFDVGDEEQGWVVTGFDETLLERGVPTLGERAERFATDEAAFRALLADPGLIIIDDFFLDGSGGPGGERYQVGETVTMINPTTEERRDLEIIAIMASDFIFAGSYMGADHVSEFLGSLARPGRFFVAIQPDVDPVVLSGRLNAELLEFGVEAATFDAEVEAEVGETLGIFRLFQGFLSLGLVIGVAGLAVVLIRAVRERRRSIGVLRALGFSETVVRRSFLIEAAFVAVQGAAMGIGLGLLTAYQVLVNSDTFGESDFTFAWPWAALAVTLLLPTLAALAAAAAPAVRAARISPAVALRAE